MEHKPGSAPAGQREGDEDTMVLCPRRVEQEYMRIWTVVTMHYWVAL